MALKSSTLVHRWRCPSPLPCDFPAEHRCPSPLPRDFRPEHRWRRHSLWGPCYIASIVAVRPLSLRHHPTVSFGLPINIPLAAPSTIRVVPTATRASIAPVDISRPRTRRPFDTTYPSRDRAKPTPSECTLPNRYDRSFGLESIKFLYVVITILHYTHHIPFSIVAVS